MFQALLFDLGGTLVYRNAKYSELLLLSHQAMVDYLDKQGYAVRLDVAMDISNTIYNTYHTFSEESYIELDSHQLYSAILYRLGVTEYTNKEIIAGAIESFYSPVLEAYYTTNEVRSTLNKIKEHNFKLGLVSNSHNTEMSRQLIQKNNLEEFFDAIVISSHLGTRKPHQDIFLHCLELLNVKIENAMFIGDSLFHDVQGAKNAGITCAWLNRKNEPLKPEDPHPDYEIQELTELLGILI